MTIQNRTACVWWVIACLLACLATSHQARAQAVQVPLGEQCFSALAPTSGGPGGTGTGYVGLLGTITPGFNGTSGTYGGVAMTGGSGTGATANITVSGGGVTAVAIINAGSGYVAGDVLSAATGNIGNVTGFAVPVASVAVNQALAGGSVGYYIPGTLTPSQTWQNASETVLNPNPITLDANGCAIVYGSGIYRQIVQDANGNTVWDQVTSAGLSGFTIAGDSFLCNPTASTGVVQACSQTQATALINTFTSSLSGAAPPSGGGTSNFLRADGTWASANGGAGLYVLSHATGSWVCTSPSGSTVSTAGSTTSGLQECVNAAQANKGNFQAICPSGGSSTPLFATTTVTFGPNIFSSYDLRGCTLQTSASTTGIQFDTFAQGVKFDWGAGSIIAGASMTDIVLVKPNTGDPIFGSKVSEGSYYHLPYILGYGAGSAAATAHGFHINPNAQSTSAFVNNIVIIDGIDGNAASLNVAIDLLIDNPTTVSNAVAQNWFNIPFLGNFDSIGIQEQTANPSIANSVLDNYWYTNINNGNGAGTADGIVTIGGNDTWTGSVTSNNGVMSICVDVAGAKGTDNNFVGLQILEGCTTAVADSGSRNSYNQAGASGYFVAGQATVFFPAVSTTASSANVNMNAASSPFVNQILRSTSSLRYKADIRPVALDEARRILKLDPINFRSLASADDHTRRFEGLAAEQVAKQFPQFTDYIRDKDGKLVPDGVQYDRLSAVALLAVVKDQERRIAVLEKKNKRHH
jgi:hypothetical protein